MMVENPWSTVELTEKIIEDLPRPRKGKRHLRS